MMTEPARVAIETEEVWFEGTTDYNHRGELWIPHPSPVNYSGVGPAVDKAWEDLVWGQYAPCSKTTLRCLGTISTSC